MDGTIMKHFPFVSDETRGVLESVMKRAVNYYEFALDLGEFVLNQSSSEELALIAAVHAWRIQEQRLLQRMAEHFSESPGIVAFTYRTTSVQDRFEFAEVVSQNADAALEETLPSWIQVTLLSHKAYMGSTVFPIANTHENIEDIRRIIASDPELNCFLIYVNILQAILFIEEGDMTNGLHSSMKGLELARKYNHQYHLSSCLRSTGNILRNVNPVESIDYLEEANSVITKLGVPQRMHEVRNDLGLTFTVLGEYDLAVESYLSALEVYDSGLGPDDTVSFNLAHVYSQMGHHLDSLEWIDTAFNYHDGKGFSMMYSLKAESLIRMNKFEEVDALLDEAQQLALASESEHGIGRVHRARGIYAAAKELWPEAISHLEEAYSYLTSKDSILQTNAILLELARVESEQSMHSKTSLEDDVSGPWMTKLLQHARKYRLPGIAMQAAILQSDLLTSMNKTSLAREKLETALDILDSASVGSIRNEIKERLSGLE